MTGNDNQQLFRDIFEKECYMIRKRWFSWAEIQQMTYFDFKEYTRAIIEDQKNEDIKITKKNN